MSGNYLSNELLNEFGKISTSEVPVGNKYLIEYQISILKKLNSECSIYVSKPKDNNTSNNYLKHLKVNIIELSSNLSLNESLEKALRFIIKKNHSNKTIQILYGDGLYQKILKKNHNFFTVSKSNYLYNWGFLNENNLNKSNLVANNSKIFTGYFQIDNIKEFIKCLNSNTNIMDSIKVYSEKILDVEFVDYESWMDFGHLNSYFKSKSKFTTERYFNDITRNDMYLIKKSFNKQKIKNEFEWYKNIPDDIKLHTPHVWGLVNNENYSSYKIEYKYFPTFSELFVFGNLPHWKWKNIINKSIGLVKKFKNFKSPRIDFESVFHNLYESKTKKRINDIDPLLRNNLKEICDFSLEIIREDKPLIGLMHGDFCFSNLLWDSRSQQINIIDPRGSLDYENSISSIYGDIGYDLAKFLHSSFGFYDFVVSDRILKPSDFDYLENKHNKINNYIFDIINDEFGIKKKSLIARLIILFSTMIPLHKDKPHRQKNFFILVDRLKKYI